MVTLPIPEGDHHSGPQGASYYLLFCFYTRIEGFDLKIQEHMGRRTGGRLLKNGPCSGSEDVGFNAAVRPCHLLSLDPLLPRERWGWSAPPGAPQRPRLWLRAPPHLGPRPCWGCRMSGHAQGSHWTDTKLTHGITCPGSIPSPPPRACTVAPGHGRPLKPRTRRKDAPSGSPPHGGKSRRHGRAGLKAAITTNNHRFPSVRSVQARVGPVRASPCGPSPRRPR